MVKSSEKKGDDSIRQLDERLLELSSLFEISRSLTASLSIHSILENILRIPMGHMLISRGVVLLKKDPEGDYVLEELKGLPRNLIGKTLTMDNPPARALLLKDIKDPEDWFEFFREFKIELILPLNSSQGAIGIIGFGEKIGAQNFTERELEFLDSLSNIAASAVNNGVMVEEIRRVNRNLDRKVQQLNTIFDISRELNTTLDKKKIGSLLSFAVMGELIVNKCMVLMRKGQEMELLVSKGLTAEIEPGLSLCEIAEPVFPDESPRFRSFHDLGLKILVPMRIHDETRGILAVGPKLSGASLEEAEKEFLKTLGNQAMTSLENARLFEEALEKQRMEEELNLARSIQQGLLPSELPQVTGFRIAAQNIPSREVGGDYFDVFRIDENRLAIAIADVSGKGAGAALLMANLQAGLHAFVLTGIGLQEMVTRINDLIFQNTALDKFITFFMGILDVKERTLSYCNAGHNPPYQVTKKGEITELMTGGIILGMLQNITYETATLPLQSGDRFVMYTDGITEAMNENEQEFGEERLQSLIRFHAEDAASMLQRIIEDVQSFGGSAPQSDDITLVILDVL